MDSNTLIMSVLGNSLSFLPRGFPEHVFIFNSKRAVRGVRETVRGGSRRGSGDKKGLECLSILTQQAGWTHPHLGSALPWLPRPQLFLYRQWEVSNSFSWGKWWELGRELCFPLENGSKGKNLCRFHNGFISFYVYKEGPYRFTISQQVCYVSWYP